VTQADAEDLSRRKAEIDARYDRVMARILQLPASPDTVRSETARPGRDQDIQPGRPAGVSDDDTLYAASQAAADSLGRFAEHLKGKYGQIDPEIPHLLSAYAEAQQRLLRALLTEVTAAGEHRAAQGPDDGAGLEDLAAGAPPSFLRRLWHALWESGPPED
jgi:hypothetical protein